MIGLQGGQWTGQEIGRALGKSVPSLVVRLEVGRRCSLDPERRGGTNP